MPRNASLSVKFQTTKVSFYSREICLVSPGPVLLFGLSSGVQLGAIENLPRPGNTTGPVPRLLITQL